MKNNVLIAAAVAALVIVIGVAYYALGMQGSAPSEPIGWGLSGMVYDQNKVPLPGAVVTIYTSSGEKLNMKDNPQYTSNGSTGAAGSYMFRSVPEGSYNVTAEKEGHMWYATVEWGENASLDNLNIAIPDFSYMTGTATPVPGSLKAAPVEGPWATLTGTVTDNGGRPVPNATVTLWALGYDKNGSESNLGKAIVTVDSQTNASNPALTYDGSKGAPGIYVFYRVPWGWYNVTAEANGSVWSAKVIVGQGGQFGTVICNVGGLVSTPDRIEGFGTISGIVTDQNKVGVPGANVTLWTARWNNDSGRWENLAPVKIKDNPQLSNNGSTGAPGMYTFYMAPWSMYNVTAEKDGHTWFSIVLLGPGDAYKNASYVPGAEYGTATHNIAIPDYTYMPPQK